MALGGCADTSMQGELEYVVTSPSGEAVSERDLQHTVTTLDNRLGEAGVERKDVAALGPGRIRVVLPESIVSRLPELRKVLEDPEGLRVELQRVER